MSLHRVASPDVLSPVQVRPLSEGLVNHIMGNLSDIYFMQVDEYEHVSWLLLRGLIREHETHGILQSLQVPRRIGHVMSPTMLQPAPGHSTPDSVSMVQAPPPPTWAQDMPLSPPPGMGTQTTCTAMALTALPALPPMPAPPQLPSQSQTSLAPCALPQKKSNASGLRMASTDEKQQIASPPRSNKD